MNYLIITGLFIIILILLTEQLSVVNRLRMEFSARKMRLLIGLALLSVLVIVFPRLRDTYSKFKQRLS